MKLKDGELARAARNPYWRWAAIAGLIAAAAVAASGGLSRASRGVMAKPPLAAGQRVEAGALAITPLRAWVSDRTVTGIATTRPEQYLVLRARVENLTPTGYSAYSYLMRDLLLFTDSIGGTPPGVIPRDPPPAGEPQTMPPDTLARSDDHSFEISILPKLPVDVDFVWKIPSDRKIPQTMTWGLLGRDFVDKTFLTRDSGWVAGKGKARWELPVEDRRGQETTP